jgi:hypothetical protein
MPSALSLSLFPLNSVSLGLFRSSESGRLCGGNPLFSPQLRRAGPLLSSQGDEDRGPDRQNGASCLGDGSFGRYPSCMWFLVRNVGGRHGLKRPSTAASIRRKYSEAPLCIENHAGFFLVGARSFERSKGSERALADLAHYGISVRARFEERGEEFSTGNFYRNEVSSEAVQPCLMIQGSRPL